MVINQERGILHCRQAAGGEQKNQPEPERAWQCDSGADRRSGGARAHPLPGLEADAHPGGLSGRQLQDHHDGHRLPRPRSLLRCASLCYALPALVTAAFLALFGFETSPSDSLLHLAGSQHRIAWPWLEKALPMPPCVWYRSACTDLKYNLLYGSGSVWAVARRRTGK